MLSLQSRKLNYNTLHHAAAPLLQLLGQHNTAQLLRESFCMLLQTVSASAARDGWQVSLLPLPLPRA